MHPVSMTEGRTAMKNRISILNMGPHNEYILTEVNNLEENEANVDEKNGQRVEVFINNEYKGMYLIKSIPEKDKKTSTID